MIGMTNRIRVGAVGQLTCGGDRKGDDHVKISLG